jgi:hypothetical protein
MTVLKLKVVILIKQKCNEHKREMKIRRQEQRNKAKEMVNKTVIAYSAHLAGVLGRRNYKTVGTNKTRLAQDLIAVR